MIELEFLGTGTSTGVPLIGCDCAVCQSDDPRDQRLRSSALVRSNGTTILIDTAPDLRQQMLRSGNRQVDAVLYTHVHADHTAGLDEMRVFNLIQQEWIPAYAPDNAIHDLRKRFGYAFVEEYPMRGVKPDLTLTSIDDLAPLEIRGVTVQPIPVMHGRLPILGYRFGDLAYLTDVKTLPEEACPLLDGIDTLVLTALRQHAHPAHMHLDEALAMIERIGPRTTYLSHASHDLGRFSDVEPTLPPHVHLAYDGLTVTA